MLARTSPRAVVYVMLILAGVIVMVSFTAISLRKETAELIIAVRKRFEVKQEYRRR